MNADERLAEFVNVSRKASKPSANFRNAVSWRGLLFLSGKSAPHGEGEAPRGKLGREYSIEEGRHFAHLAALELLLVMKDELGSLERVEQVLELQGFVNSTDEFDEHSQVLDGASDTLVAVLGDAGVHSRSVLGANSLRGGQPVSLRAVVATRPGKDLISPVREPIEPGA